MKQTYTFRLSLDTHKILKQHAKQQWIPLSEVVEQALDGMLVRQETDDHPLSEIVVDQLQDTEFAATDPANTIPPTDDTETEPTQFY